MKKIMSLLSGFESLGIDWGRGGGGGVEDEDEIQLLKKKSIFAFLSIVLLFPPNPGGVCIFPTMRDDTFCSNKQTHAWYFFRFEQTVKKKF